MANEILTMEIENEAELEIDLNENRIDPYLQIEDVEVVEIIREIDIEMSDTSTNLVQNNTIKSYIDSKADKTYVHNQITASNKWIIEHNLEKYPTIAIIDSGNTTVVGEIEYVNLNLVYVTFNGIFSGKAFCN